MRAKKQDIVRFHTNIGGLKNKNMFTVHFSYAFQP